MVKKRKVVKEREVESIRCSNCRTFFKILLVILAILIVLILIYSSGLVGNTVYSPCMDSDNTVSVNGQIVAGDPSLSVKGSVSHGYTTIEDTCESGSGSQRVIEFFCEDGYRNSKAIACPDGCFDGACK